MDLDLSRLTDAAEPWFHGLCCEGAKVSQLARDLGSDEFGGAAARVVRGTRAKATAALYDEFAAALQFPLYFGENWDAFHDCLCDLAWLNNETIVLFVAEAVHLLEDAPADEFVRFLSVLQSAVRHWNEPAKTSWFHNKSFHVIFAAGLSKRKAVEARFQGAKVELDWLG